MIRLILVASFVIGLFAVFLRRFVPAEEAGADRLGDGGVEELKYRKAGLFRDSQDSGSKGDCEGSGTHSSRHAGALCGKPQKLFRHSGGLHHRSGAFRLCGKKEMLKIPLLSQWMVQVNCLFMDRQNVKEGLKTILQGIEKIKRGVSIWIFPEGTRNRNEKETDLLPFKEGSLKIAEKTGCPVIPVAITGTADVFEKHLPFIRPAHVTIEFGEPFFVKELPPEQKKFPGAYTRDRILEMLEKEQHGLTGDQEAAGQH